MISHLVVAFEIDVDLKKILESKFENHLKNGRLQLRFCDVLNEWKKRELLDRPYALVANLPYYIATNIILKALRDKNCSLIVVMVQKEVAQKFVAKSGDKEFSALSVLANSCGKAKILFDIKKESFYPPPKVESSMLMIEKSSFLEDDEFEEFLKIAFKHPRKKLINNLSTAYKLQKLQNIFVSLDIKDEIRPHQLKPSAYHLLYKLLKGG